MFYKEQDMSQFFPQLKTLILNNNKITELKTIQLNNLTELQLDNNEIKKVSIEEGLGKIEKLSLNNNNIQSVNITQEITSLK